MPTSNSLQRLADDKNCQINLPQTVGSKATTDVSGPSTRAAARLALPARSEPTPGVQTSLSAKASSEVEAPVQHGLACEFSFTALADRYHLIESMTAYINKDTQVCMSLAARPGNTGTRLHNYLYRELGLNFVYKAFTTKDLAAAIGGIRALGIRGCAISMPFKEDCISMLDEIDASASGIQSVNTIVNTEGHLKGYNTDYTAVFSLLKSHRVPTDLTFALLGSGGMAKAVACALRDAGFLNGTIVARNTEKGSSLAKHYGFDWKPDLDESDNPNVLINVTPIGMSGGSASEDLAFPEKYVDAARFVFDVVALPSETPLISLARTLGKSVISGAEVMTLQAIEQFVLYTGIRPDSALVDRASSFSRQEPAKLSGAATQV